MAPPAEFAEVLDAVDRLDPEAQAELVALVGRRLAERGRAHVVERVAEARRELAAGLCCPATPKDMVRGTTATFPALPAAEQAELPALLALGRAIATLAQPAHA